jgi:hypothetical protein
LAYWVNLGDVYSQAIRTAIAKGARGGHYGGVPSSNRIGANTYLTEMFENRIKIIGGDLRGFE